MTNQSTNTTVVNPYKNKETPQIGEIWGVVYPELFYDEDGTLLVKIYERPFLVIDDGRGLIVQESDNYHCQKITSKISRDVGEIPNWEEKGLKMKSYYRIEMPLKIEFQQFKYRITSLDHNELKEVYKNLFEYINVEALEKLAEE